MNNSTELMPAPEAPIAPFGSVSGFEAAQRVAKALMSADIVPQQFRGNMGNTLIAMEMAARTGSSILAVMQSIYVVHGKPGWSGAYCIAALNQSGRFAEPLHFEFQGTEGRDDWGCRAVTTTKAGKRVEGPLVTIKTAKSEGWYNRRESKWQTMPELMLRYRAATWFARTEAPELLMGMSTVEELADIGPSEVRETGVTIQSLQAAMDEPDDVFKGEGPTAREVIESSESEPIGPAWPKVMPDGKFVDSSGQEFNPTLHSDPHSINADGTFRARRGAGKRAQKPKQNPAPAADTEAEPEDKLTLALEALKTADTQHDEEWWDQAHDLRNSLNEGERRVFDDAAKGVLSRHEAWAPF